MQCKSKKWYFLRKSFAAACCRLPLQLLLRGTMFADGCLQPDACLLLLLQSIASALIANDLELFSLDVIVNFS